ncbi:MAG: hypothetical protein AMXMBFR61_08040 [Fimbriimonadales bacterium]
MDFPIWLMLMSHVLPCAAATLTRQLSNAVASAPGLTCDAVVGSGLAALDPTATGRKGGPPWSGIIPQNEGLPIARGDLI